MKKTLRFIISCLMAVSLLTTSIPVYAASSQAKKIPISEKNAIIVTKAAISVDEEGTGEANKSTENEDASFDGAVADDETPALGEAANTDNVTISFVNGDTYVYTGYAIKPEITVTYGGTTVGSVGLVEGIDYTVNYKNNINAGSQNTSTKYPCAYLKFKGNYVGSVVLPFTIEQAYFEDVVMQQKFSFVKGTTPTPILAYNGKLLTSADYYTDLKPGVKVEKSIKIRIAPQRNFKFSDTSKSYVEINATAVNSKDNLETLGLNIQKTPLLYNGSNQKPNFLVWAKSSGMGQAAINDGKDYHVSLQNDRDEFGVYSDSSYALSPPALASDDTRGSSDVGTYNYIVFGDDKYTGVIKKTYKILAAELTNVDVKDTANTSKTFRYEPSGDYSYQDTITVGGNFQGGAVASLVKDKDYKITLSSKKVGKTKVTVSFMGNFAGTKAHSLTYEIIPADITNTSLYQMEVYLPDVNVKSFAKPISSIKVKPIVVLNDYASSCRDFVLSSKDYEVKLYTNLTTRNPLDKTNPLTAPGIIYVEIEGKGNYQGVLTNRTNYLTGSVTTKYYAYNSSVTTLGTRPTGGASYPLNFNVDTVTAAYDMTKAKISLNPTSAAFTGTDIFPAVSNVDINKASVPTGAYTVEWANNIKKGKGYVIVTGNPGMGYKGTKIVNFTITSADIGDKYIIQ